MGKWVLYTQPNYAHPKPTHLPPIGVKDFINSKVGDGWCEGKSLFSCCDLKLRLGLERDL